MIQNGKIAYYAGDKTKLYLNIVDNYNCTNNCDFCDPNLIEELLGVDLFLEKKPTLIEILNAVEKELSKNKIDEFIFCGISEPTYHFQDLLDVIHALHFEYFLPIRLNTNGQGQLINPNYDVVNELAKAGLDTVSVSLNATNKAEYNKIHKPQCLDKAFDSVIKFIHDAKSIGMKTYVSFVEFPGLNKDNIYEFTRKLDIGDENVRFRKLID